ncbi:unnamed protein product [Rotaria sordida]|uniref:Uncharacterized protein n=1 Tax=Rotaria sordida TaxID=392033 RepID=A0A814TAV6_9BILA|nr:unnamed protein product [Rotaria sordida]CAF1320355.1 unnamed protein product [Rotaria sordida]CAF3776187.1 unnamed protein product [Rotaria sordida]
MFICRGCSKTFCLVHTNEHREILEKQMNDIIINHNRLKQYITSDQIEQYYQVLMKQIDEWEKQSINKIYQTANEIRQQLIIMTRENHKNLKEKLTPLTQEITKAQHDKNFFEDDLKQWTNTIQLLERTFIDQENIHISLINNGNPLVSKISLINKINDTITTSNNFLTYETNYNPFENCTISNLNDGYSSDDHLFRFKLELYQSNSLVLMGIISKNKSKNIDPYNNPTFYGWSTNNLVYLHGIAYSDSNNYQSDIENNDVFQLILDCNRKLIRLTNERTRQTYELNIDITKCPFPWQPHVRILNNLVK